MYYVTMHGTNLNMNLDHGFNDHAKARDWADKLHARTGDHFHVIHVETVYTTTTLNDLMQDNRAVLLNRNLKEA